MKIFAIAVCLCLVLSGVAWGGASNDWNGSWQFLSPAEKLNLREQALAIQFMEGGGYSETNNITSSTEVLCSVSGSCSTETTTSIGNMVTVTGDNNDVGSENSGEINATTNNIDGDLTNE